MLNSSFGECEVNVLESDREEFRTYKGLYQYVQLLEKKYDAIQSLLGSRNVRLSKLQAQLDVAIKALKIYANAKPSEWYTGVEADKALKRIEEIK